MTVLLAAALALPPSALMQNKKPISKTGLINSVRINGLTTRELVQQIERRGVDFEMTAADEGELRAAGARPEVIEAARANHRAAAAPAVAARPTAPVRPANTSSSGSAPVPAGPPLSKSEVVTMLQGGIAPARVEQFVEVRGVNFAFSPEVASEIKQAGGNNALLGAIAAKSAEFASYKGASGSDSPFAGTGAAGAGPDYDDLIDSANAAASASDFRGTINFLQQAVRLDPAQPTAYTLLGTVMLYAGQDFNAADQAMRAALQRGGAAAFRVIHDHDGTFRQHCTGSFFVTKTGVSFKADDGVDTFETEDSNIKTARVNAFVGSEVGAFHIKPVQRINGRDNFNFAPATGQKAESQLLLRLIKEF
ncbi:MAG TPA: hypothetical protein VEY09_05835 [Pyrinomonadaceae bacterium]|nr:hypothetical protein [Pyrinomonadaceae bacterium]